MVSRFRMSINSLAGYITYMQITVSSECLSLMNRRGISHTEEGLEMFIRWWYLVVFPLPLWLSVLIFFYRKSFTHFTALCPRSPVTSSPVCYLHLSFGNLFSGDDVTYIYTQICLETSSPFWTPDIHIPKILNISFGMSHSTEFINVLVPTPAKNICLSIKCITHDHSTHDKQS